MTMVYSDPTGHRLKPPAVRARILREGLPALLGGDVFAAPPPARVLDAPINTAGHHVLGIPAGVSFVRLLTEPRLLPGEGRWLGAAIAAIRLDGRSISLSDPSLVNGLHPDERTHRWTDGKGVVPVLVGDRGSVLEIEVVSVAANCADK